MKNSDHASNHSLKWYHYVAVFFAALFLTNAIPHFVNGISGNMFPTPFANPPGKGLSSPLTNVLWALLNMLIGYILFIVSKITTKNKWSLIIFFVGILCMSIMLSLAFVDKVKM